MATLNENSVFDGNVFKIQLDMYDPEKKLLCSLIEQILNFLFTKL